MTNWRFYNDYQNEKKDSYKSNNISNDHNIWNSIRIVLLIVFGLGLFKSDIFKSFYQDSISPVRQNPPINNPIDFNNIPKYPKIDLKNFQTKDFNSNNVNDLLYPKNKTLTDFSKLNQFKNPFTLQNRDDKNIVFDAFLNKIGLDSNNFKLREFKPIDLESNDFKLKEFKPIDLESNDFKLKEFKSIDLESNDFKLKEFKSFDD